jgi:hypothetical protein
MSIEGTKQANFEPALQVSPWSAKAGTAACACLVVAAGFEERALALLGNIPRTAAPATALLITYKSRIRQNLAARVRAKRLLARLVRPKDMAEIELDISRAGLFAQQLRVALLEASVPGDGEVWIDVSGLTMFGLCTLLQVVRRTCPLRPIRVFYTEAKEYYPLRDEFAAIEHRQLATIDDRSDVPESLTTEVDQVLLLDTFRGFAIRDAPTCLLMVAGFERHRSAAVIETINPSRLVLVYGVPRRADLRWRVTMSRALHRTFAAQRESAEEECPTLDLVGMIRLITQYYNMLYDSHNFCIAPTSGKLHTVAAYLAWEFFPDVQLVFTIPVTYLPDRYSHGVGLTFSCPLPLVPGAEVLTGATLDRQSSSSAGPQRPPRL